MRRFEKDIQALGWLHRYFGGAAWLYIPQLVDRWSRFVPIRVHKNEEVERYMYSCLYMHETLYYPNKCVTLKTHRCHLNRLERSSRPYERQESVHAELEHLIERDRQNLHHQSVCRHQLILSIWKCQPIFVHHLPLIVVPKLYKRMHRAKRLSGLMVWMWVNM
jgi:hypothetical protein